jgi:hypothetical protein
MYVLSFIWICSFTLLESPFRANNLRLGYAVPSTSMRVDENINDIVRNSPTLTEDDNSLKLDRDIVDSGYLNPYQFIYIA